MGWFTKDGKHINPDNKKVRDVSDDDVEIINNVNIDEDALEEFAKEKVESSSSVDWDDIGDSKIVDKGSHYETSDGRTIIWSSYDSEKAQRFLKRRVDDNEIKSIKLENRANSGIRAYTEEFDYEGYPLVLEIITHYGRHHYMIEPYWHGKTEGVAEVIKLNRELSNVDFKSFNDAKSYIEKRFNLDLQLDKENSNDYQTWEENIKYADSQMN